MWATNVLETKIGDHKFTITNV